MKIRFLTAVVVIGILTACSTPKVKIGGTGATGSTPSQVGAPETLRGPAPDSIEYFNTVVGNTVHFDFNEFVLNAEDQETLRSQAQWLSQHPARVVSIEGHCDERGTREYDLGLGERRANAIKQYLVSLGVNANRLTTISFGKERPLCVSSEESCWSRNRRGVSVLQ